MFDSDSARSRVPWQMDLYLTITAGSKMWCGCGVYMVKRGGEKENEENEGCCVDNSSNYCTIIRAFLLDMKSEAFEMFALWSCFVGLGSYFAAKDKFCQVWCHSESNARRAGLTNVKSDKPNTLSQDSASTGTLLNICHQLWQQAGFQDQIDTAMQK